MLSRIRELREKRGKLAADAQALIPKDGSPLTPENRQKFDRLMREADDLKVAIDLEEQRAEATALDRDTRRTSRPPEGPIISDFDRACRRAEGDGYREAFRGYLRRGESGLSEEERATLRRATGEFRDMGVGTGNLGGYFVPQGFVYDVEVALKYYGPMLQVSKILDTATGNPLPYPTTNDTTVTGAIVAEGSQVSEADVSVGHIIFGAYKFSTNMVKVSLELLQDSAFDMEGFLKDQFAIRLGRILNTKFTVGAGTTEPLGLITAIAASLPSPQAASSGVAIGTPLIAAGSSTNTGGTETGGHSIGSSDLINLEHTVDPLYRRGAKFLMNDSTLRQIKTLLDKYGRPLWLPGLASGSPDTIDGYEYAVNNDMAAIAPSAVTVAFGPMEKYLIRRVRELAVLRLVERYPDYGQVAFLGFARYDGNLLDAGTHPIYLIQASS